MFRRASAILALVIFPLLTMRAFAVSQAFTGTATDTMCGKKHMSPGKSDADCTRDCMKSKGGWTYGMVVGNSVYRPYRRQQAIRHVCRTAGENCGRPDRDHNRCPNNRARKMKRRRLANLASTHTGRPM